MTAFSRTSGPNPNPWWVAVVSGAASYIDAAAITGTATALVLYQESIDLTGDQIGLLTGVLALCIAVGALGGGRLGDAFGRRPVFVVTVGLVAAGAVTLALSTSFPLLLLGVVMVGLGAGADLPVSLATIAEMSTQDNRGALIGLSNLLWFGGLVSTIVLSVAVGDAGRLGGQILFVHVAAAAVVVLLLRMTLPESPLWLQGREERRAGIGTVRAATVSPRALLAEPYRAPFLALMTFYTLTNLFAYTFGAFNTYIAVTVVGLDVDTAALLSLPALPLGLVLGLWFMRIADTPRRTGYFRVGAVCFVAAALVPAVFGLSVPTLVVEALLLGVGTSFAFEAILKVWTQESFPTLLRSTAQGAIVAVARFAGAAFAVITPAFVAASPRGLFLTLAVAAAVGLAVAWATFRNRTRNEFLVESDPAGGAGPQDRVVDGTGVRATAPGAGPAGVVHEQAP